MKQIVQKHQECLKVVPELNEKYLFYLTILKL